jgi:hypothetical protein
MARIITLVSQTRQIMNDVTLTLARLRRRMMGQFFIERLAVCALFFAALLLVATGFDSVCGVALFGARIGAVFALGAFVSALVWTWLKTPTLEQTAIRVDGLAQTRDRFLTAYAFSKVEDRTVLQDIAIGECRRFIAAFDVAACTRFRFPSLLPWLLVPLVAFGLLAWHSNLAGKAAAGRLGRRATPDQSQELEKLARAIDAANGKVKSDDLKKIAEEIRKGGQRLQSADADGTQKAVLREMSSLESMIQEMLKSRNNSPPEELAALAGALKQSELTKAAADALQAGKPDEAAEKLERLLQQQQQDAALDKVAQAIQQALSRLQQNQKGEIGRQLEQMAKSGGQNGGQSLQRLAELLRKTGNAQQGQTAGDSHSQQTMRNILSALQNLKYDAQQGRISAGSQQGNSDSKSMMPSFGQSNAQGGQQLSMTNIPSGMPGSEHDAGTTENPYGAQQKKGGNEASGSQLNGALGEGESLHDFISTTGDSSKSNRHYRDLYNAMLPAAEEAVQQEAIPLGSRFYIKRYFQAIRPKE